MKLLRVGGSFALVGLLATGMGLIWYVGRCLFPREGSSVPIPSVTASLSKTTVPPAPQPNSAPSVAAASKAVSTKELPIPVVTTGRGRFIATDPILFNSGVSMLREASIPELDKVARLLKQNPDIKLEIIGFSDNLGIEPANQKVSLDRAAAVMDYLVSQGIEPFRLKCRGMGSLYPMDTNETKLGRQANRRIELRIVEQGEKQESLREESQE